MKKVPELDPLAPRPNTNFSKGVRGKHYKQMQERSNFIVVDADLWDRFPSAESVNRVLRAAVAAGLDKEAIANH